MYDNKIEALQSLYKKLKDNDDNNWDNIGEKER